KRQPHPEDRRRLVVQMTEQGQQNLIKMLPDHFCRTTGLIAHLSLTEQKTLIQLLSKLQAGVPAMRDF
ncbi:MAG: winged helix-turn-helix transcriptional regulator, partial [Nostoc sp. C3-bin3]|nr:winged helix-turn-helix transcriptional regulator [Nostoc sp. C3-bin3]